MTAPTLVPKSRVVNLREFRGTALPPDVVRIDRTTRWGNPFVIGQPAVGGPFDLRPVRRMTRANVLDGYRWWLRQQLEDDPQFLEPLRSKRLACWCAPLPCHGDVIAEFVEW